MTDDDKALVKLLRVGDPYEVGKARHEAADRIEALTAENERLRYELRCIFNDYQGCMADEWIADVRAALGDTE